MGKSAGKAPDFRGAAVDTANSSREAVDRQTAQNRPGINTPWMQQQWTTGPDGTPIMTNSFNGGLGQGVADATNQAGAELSRGMDANLFAPIMSGQQARDQAIEGAFNQSMSRLNPMLNQRETQLRSRLANQGLDPNSQAYRSASQGFGRDRNDAIQSAMASAISQGTDAGNTALMGNIASSQANIGNALTRRRTPLQDLGILQGLMQTPQFNQAGRADATDYSGAASSGGEWRMRDAQQQNQMWGDLIGGLLGAGGSVAGGFIGRR